MRYAIQNNDDGTFQVVSVEGDTLTKIGEPHREYDDAVRALGDELTRVYRELAAADLPADQTSGDGLLTEAWTDDKGIAFSEALPGGRDFTDCVWSWRDPTVSLLPLMFQSSTSWGHDGAELAGFIETLSEDGGTVHASGRFYDSEVGRTARDLLLDGRRFGVSVDPSEAVDAEFVCTETDEFGWCMDGLTKFTAYEIAGLTMTPFPGFAEAAIVLEGGDAGAEQDGAAAVAHVVASAFPIAPPIEWFTLPEPVSGEVWGELGAADEWLIEQGDGSVAVPLTILDSGQWFGHIARWGQCHVAEPWGAGVCATPPVSEAAYAHFHVGEVVTASGQRIATGSLTVGCEHAPDHLDAWAARDHYAHAGNGWANGRMSNGEYGVWGCGALRPDVTAEQLAILRALTMSGDWRRLGGNLELIAALAVNTPGYPIARENVPMMVASAGTPHGSIRGGRQDSLVAAGLVARCSDCQKRRAAAGGVPQPRPGLGADREVLDLLRVVERRTRHLIPDAARAARDRIG